MFWRSQADFDTYRLLDEKTLDPRWALPRLDIEPDPRSRFYDPYPVDFGPLPPDDPTAHETMHCVAGKRGSKSWHKFGRAMSIENPHWLEPFGVPPEAIKENGSICGPLPRFEKINLVQALELSNINSRNYQTQIENLYLTSLPLTTRWLIIPKPSRSAAAKNSDEPVACESSAKA